MVENINGIPRRKFAKLLNLTEKLKFKRLSGRRRLGKSNHAAYILTKKLDVVSYGENNYRNSLTNITKHAEHDAIKNINRSTFKKNKTYSIFVTKLSPKIGQLGNSSCCIRCQLRLLKSGIKINKVYYSVNGGIACSHLNNLDTYITERDRNIYNSGATKVLAELGSCSCDDEDNDDKRKIDF